MFIYHRWRVILHAFVFVKLVAYQFDESKSACSDALCSTPDDCLINRTGIIKQKLLLELKAQAKRYQLLQMKLEH